MPTDIPILAQRPEPTAYFEFECQTEHIATSIRILYAELIAAIERDLPNTATPDLQRLVALHESVMQEMEVRHAATAPALSSHQRNGRHHHQRGTRRTSRRDDGLSAREPKRVQQAHASRERTRESAP